MNFTHRFSNRRHLAVAAVIAVVVVAVAGVAAITMTDQSTGRNATTGTDTAEVVDPGAWVQAQYTACQAGLRTPPVISSSQKTRLTNCLADAKREMGALATPGPVPTTPVPSSTAPAPTPSATTGPVVHGRDINQTNTGYLAWVGSAGQRCTDATLKVYSTKVNASSLGAAASCVWLKAGITVDAPITLTAAKIDRTVIGSSTYPLVLNWVSVDANGSGEYALGGENVTAFRSQFFNASDGVRFERMNLIEDWIRVVSTSTTDHNDGIQAYLSDGNGSIIRCNIDTRPQNLASGSGILGNGAIFMADDSRGEVAIRDNYLLGGGYTLRLHESMTYRVTGNVIAAGTYNFGPLTTDNAVAGAFLEWSNNTVSTGQVLTP